MTHYTIRDGDTVSVYSDTSDGLIFRGSIEEWAEWKIERDQPRGTGITVELSDGETYTPEPQSGPYADADPEEVIADYEENGWFESDTSVVPNFCL